MKGGDSHVREMMAPVFFRKVFQQLDELIFKKGTEK